MLPPGVAIEWIDSGHSAPTSCEQFVVDNFWTVYINRLRPEPQWLIRVGPACRSSSRAGLAHRRAVTTAAQTRVGVAYLSMVKYTPYPIAAAASRKHTAAITI